MTTRRVIIGLTAAIIATLLAAFPMWVLIQEEWGRTEQGDFWGMAGSVIVVSVFVSLFACLFFDRLGFFEDSE